MPVQGDRWGWSNGRTTILRDWNSLSFLLQIKTGFERENSTKDHHMVIMYLTFVTHDKTAWRYIKACYGVYFAFT
jgi:hypothetical protein